MTTSKFKCTCRCIVAKRNIGIHHVVARGSRGISSCIFASNISASCSGGISTSASIKTGISTSISTGCHYTCFMHTLKHAYQGKIARSWRNNRATIAPGIPGRAQPRPQRYNAYATCCASRSRNTVFEHSVLGGCLRKYYNTLMCARCALNCIDK